MGSRLANWRNGRMGGSRATARTIKAEWIPVSAQAQIATRKFVAWQRPSQITLLIWHAIEDNPM